MENSKDLLSNKDAVEEINRHRWLESEKIGQDIGFEAAAEDWLKRFSAAWIQYHLPERKKEKLVQPKKSNVIKTRRARSYIL